MTEDFLSRWLLRLGFSAPPPTTLNSLAQLQRAHLDAFAFENVDPLLGRVPNLDADATAAKLLRQGRGGYCFELNGLFAGGLRQIGFGVTVRLARVLWRRSEPGPETHCLLIVSVAGCDFVSDVGFGGPVPVAPVPLSPGQGSNESGYCLVEHDLGPLLCSRGGDGRETPLYVITPTRADPDSLAEGNRLAATAPTSPFTQRLIAARVVADRRIVLENTRLVERTLDGVEICSSQLTRSSVIDALSDRFGLTLTPDEKVRVRDWLKTQSS
ncbi:MAG: arylamine N-acetyltransferase [Alphaproteobacteria bacterium]